jgi:hypothetical protein
LYRYTAVEKASGLTAARAGGVKAEGKVTSSGTIFLEGVRLFASYLLMLTKVGLCMYYTDPLLL